MKMANKQLIKAKAIKKYSSQRLNDISLFPLTAPAQGQLVRMRQAIGQAMLEARQPPEFGTNWRQRLEQDWSQIRQIIR